jgi:NADPH:quinone reductase-like Zn-dependent oxidoreductase
MPRPAFSDNEVLVRVRAAGLDRGTWHIATGRPYVMRLVFGLHGPKRQVPGIDFAGTIVAAGGAVTRFSVGDDVYGFSTGSFAEYAVAADDKIARKPNSLSFEQAAVVPISAGTALQGLRDLGRIRSGQKVLITGASGGVGSYAVQLAKAFGAEVTAVCSTGKVDLVRSLGADHVVDYARDDFAQGGHRYDLILDIGGSPSLSRLRSALTATGTAVIVGGENAGNWTGMSRQLRALLVSPVIRQRLTMLASKERASDLEDLAPFFEAGTVIPSIDRTFPLEKAPEALHHLDAGKARGKVVITI